MNRSTTHFARREITVSSRTAFANRVSLANGARETDGLRIFVGRWIGALGVACALAAPAAGTAIAADASTSSATSQPEPAPPSIGDSRDDFLADIAERKSYWIPAGEIFGFDFLLNQFNRRFISDEYKSGLSSIRDNLRSSWRTDHDPFTTNQLGHPYQGSMYYGFARSAGLDYWESLGYTVAGSAFWEIAGETTPPSLNDQITTGFGGSFLGEALFRMSDLVIENGNMPAFWRELSAAI